MYVDVWCLFDTPKYIITNKNFGTPDDVDDADDVEEVEDVEYDEGDGRQLLELWQGRRRRARPISTIVEL